MKTSPHRLSEPFDNLGRNKCFVRINIMETILILENEDILRTLYKEELEDEGYQVLLARSDKEALEFLKKRCPDLLILEYQTEPTKFYTTLLYVASEVTNIPVIIYTSYPRGFIDYVWYGEVECLSKSSNIDNLIEKIREMLDYKRYNEKFYSYFERLRQKYTFI